MLNVEAEIEHPERFWTFRTLEQIPESLLPSTSSGV